MSLQRLRTHRRFIANLLQHAESLQLSKGARLRLAWFAYALAHEGNVSLTCRYFGISRSTFLRWANRFDPRRRETLEEQSRRPHRVRTPQTSPEITRLITQYRKSSPSMGKEQIVRKLKDEHALTVSASTVGRVIAREKLFFGDSPSHSHKRTGLDLSPTSRRDASAPASSVSPVALRQSSGESGEADAWPSTDLPLFGS